MENTGYILHVIPLRLHHSHFRYNLTLCRGNGASNQPSLAHGAMLQTNSKQPLIRAII